MGPVLNEIENWMCDGDGVYRIFVCLFHDLILKINKSFAWEECTHTHLCAPMCAPCAREAITLALCTPACIPFVHQTHTLWPQLISMKASRSFFFFFSFFGSLCVHKTESCISCSQRHHRMGNEPEKKNNKFIGSEKIVYSIKYLFTTNLTIHIQIGAQTHHTAPNRSIHSFNNGAHDDAVNDWSVPFSPVFFLFFIRLFSQDLVLSFSFFHS